MKNKYQPFPSNIDTDGTMSIIHFPLSLKTNMFNRPGVAGAVLQTPL